mmetsp:Transcript_23345/g.34936  ORF Transcript_23345/g.34936 Transcript_23345/m.34936 type:complete len:116 (-) Transcript_23345:45-392(-)
MAMGVQGADLIARNQARHWCFQTEASSCCLAPSAWDCRHSSSKVRAWPVPQGCRGAGAAKTSVSACLCICPTRRALQMAVQRSKTGFGEADTAKSLDDDDDDEALLRKLRSRAPF